MKLLKASAQTWRESYNKLTHYGKNKRIKGRVSLISLTGSNPSPPPAFTFHKEKGDQREESYLTWAEMGGGGGETGGRDDAIFKPMLRIRDG